MRQLLARFRVAGFTGKFRALAGGIEVIEPGKRYAASEVSLGAVHRIEGVTDPGEATVVIEVEMREGVRGVLIGALGPDASPELGSLLARVRSG